MFYKINTFIYEKLLLQHNCLLERKKILSAYYNKEEIHCLFFFFKLKI